MENFSLYINGVLRTVCVPPQWTLLRVLRETLGLTGAKNGCSSGDCGAVQCGFCTPGMVMSAKALLDKTLHPSDEEIREALAPNLCRCTGYYKIEEAVREAARRLEAQDR